MSWRPFGPLFWIHLTVIAIGYVSWLLFDWRIVVAGFALYHVQLWLFHDCILTRAQFGESLRSRARTTFYHRYLLLVGVRVSNDRVVFVADYIIPAAVVAAALVAQLGYGLSPLLF